MTGIADWYAERGTEAHDAAMTLCRRCPAREACLEQAIRNDEHYGIWGGLTPAQRDRVRYAKTHEGRRLVVNPRPSSLT